MSCSCIGVLFCVLRCLMKFFLYVLRFDMMMFGWKWFIGIVGVFFVVSCVFRLLSDDWLIIKSG